jgi:ubiquinol-cytochrome c reductase iron-sulfur subunit
MSAEDPTTSGRLGRTLGMLVAVRTAWRAAISRRSPTPSAPEPETDPAQRTVPADRRAETIVAVLLLLAAGFGFAFTVIYIVTGSDTQLLGVAFGGALGLLAAACIVAGKAVVPQETAVESRGLLLDDAQTDEVVEMLEQGGEGVSRRVLLTGAGGLAGAAIVTAAATPIASLGPKLSGIHDTPWHQGVRLVDDRGRPYRAEEIQVGTFYTALPEHGDPEHFAAGLLVVKLSPQQIHLPSPRQLWAPQGILAYSKICPHAGCAISLYRYPTYAPTSTGPAFTCPCHYSTFLPGEGGRLVFGPAGRGLPQLPLTIDAQGYLRAAGAFGEDIGPSWWNVRRSQS